MLRRIGQEVRALAGGLPPTYWWLWFGMLVNRLGGFVVPFLAIYLTERRGATLAEAGLISSLWGVGAIGAGPVGGLLADRVGRRRTLAGALGVSGAGMVALGFLEPLPVIAGGVLLLGFFAEMFRPAMQAAVADVVPSAEARVRAFGLVYWAVNLGFAAAVVIAGALALVSYRLLFLLDGATTLAFAGLVLWKVPETRPAGHPRAASPGGGLLGALRDPVLAALVGLNFVFAAMLFQAMTALPLDMRARGLSTAEYGALMAVNGVVIVLLQPFVTRAGARRDSARMLALAALLAGVGWGLNAFARGLPLYTAAIVIWTLGEMINNPTGPALVAQLAPPEQRGRYQGAYGLSWAVAAAVAPAGGAFLLGRLGSAALWGACLAAGVLLAWGHLSAGSARRARLERVR